MIHIEQYQAVFGSDDLKVVAPTGDYNEADLLECAPADNLGQSICMFQAQRIAFGDVVYQQDEVLSDSQVSALLSGQPADDVINNEDMIDGTAPVQTPVEPKTVTASGPTQTPVQETPTVQPEEPIEETPEETPEEPVTPDPEPVIEETPAEVTPVTDETVSIAPKRTTRRVAKVATTRKRRVA